MIATLDTVKTILKKSGTVDDDSLIEFLMPIVTNDIVSITNNNFGTEVRAWSDGLTFSASAGTITTDESTDFDYLHLADGDDICISGSLRNDGILPVSGKSGSVITIDSPFELQDEIPPSNDPRLITITKSFFPRSLQLPFAYMINYHLEFPGQLGQGIASESLGRYSVSYDMKGRQYPPVLFEMLRPYMMVSAK